MASKRKIIMAWSKCKISIAPMPEDENMAEDSAFVDIGIIRNNSTALTANDGDALQAVESGGGIVAEEKLEGDFALGTEVIEPADELYVEMGLGSKNGDDLDVKTHIVPGNYCVKLTPKNLGAKGIKAPKCSISVSPTYGDDAGHGLTINFAILQGEAGYWYKKFLHRGDLTLDKYTVDLANTDTSSSPAQTVTVTTQEDTVIATSNASWCVAKVESKTVKIGAKQNEGEARSATVTIKAGSASAIVTVKQAASE